jgi:hypothetical protein
MLWSFDCTKRPRNESDHLNRCERLSDCNNGCIQGDARRRKHIRALLGSHRLTAIVALVRSHASH